MSSVMDFQELNLYSDLASSSTITIPIVPKMEPDHEQLDEPLHAPVSKPLFFQNSIPYFLPPNTPISEPTSNSLLVLDENQVPTVMVSPLSTLHKRSSTLVRVPDLGAEGDQYFRGFVRKTRIIYESLRIFKMTRHIRGDLAAGSKMLYRGLWLYRDKRIVGSIPGVKIGDLFFFRMELCVVGLHGQTRAGIDFVPASQSSNKEPIATSIIVSEEYEDNEGDGNVIIYTSQGGHDKHLRQCVDQKLEAGNLALHRNMLLGIEVRVIRVFKYGGSASGKVYVYDGLYRIRDSWCDVGKFGYEVFKFELIRTNNQPELGSATLRLAANLRLNPLAVRPVGFVSFDISLKKENVPVILFNDIDNDYEPGHFEYIVSAVFPGYLHQQVGNRSGCECVLGCVDGCFCASRNGGEFAYDRNGVLLRGKPLIFECGPHCRCPSSCRNRVSQKGLRSRFEVFRSRETGWGVRSWDLIKAGAFICEYAGVVLTREQAELFTFNGDNLVYPNRFAERWAEWGDLSPICSDYRRPRDPSIPPLDFAMDVSQMRNFAYYIRHSSHPNVLVQFVLYDHYNLSFPHLMLFALENIPPLRELSLDYGVVYNEREAFHV